MLFPIMFTNPPKYQFTKSQKRTLKNIYQTENRGPHDQTRKRHPIHTTNRPLHQPKNPIRNQRILPGRCKPFPEKPDQRRISERRHFSYRPGMKRVSHSGPQKRNHPCCRLWNADGSDQYTGPKSAALYQRGAIDRKDHSAAPRSRHPRNLCGCWIYERTVRISDG